MFTFYQIVNPVVTGFANQKPDQAPNLLAKFISSLVGILLGVATIYAFLQLLQGGMQWISSGGDKGHLESAQNHITSAILGLVIVFVSWAVYLVILQFLGISPVGGGTGIQLQLPTLL